MTPKQLETLKSLCDPDNPAPELEPSAVEAIRAAVEQVELIQWCGKILSVNGKTAIRLGEMFVKLERVF